jgi:hypothetical protein
MKHEQKMLDVLTAGMLLGAVDYFAELSTLQPSPDESQAYLSLLIWYK